MPQAPITRAVFVVRRTRIEEAAEHIQRSAPVREMAMDETLLPAAKAHVSVSTKSGKRQFGDLGVLLVPAYPRPDGVSRFRVSHRRQNKQTTRNSLIPPANFDRGLFYSASLQIRRVYCHQRSTVPRGRSWNTILVIHLYIGQKEKDRAMLTNNNSYPSNRNGSERGRHVCTSVVYPCCCLSRRQTRKAHDAVTTRTPAR